jgi:hypothetical protein
MDPSALHGSAGDPEIRAKRGVGPALDRPPERLDEGRHAPDDAEGEKQRGHGHAEPPRRERRGVGQAPGRGPEPLERSPEEAHEADERGKRDQPAGQSAAAAPTYSVSGPRSVGMCDQVERERDRAQHRGQAAVGPDRSSVPG